MIYTPVEYYIYQDKIIKVLYKSAHTITYRVIQESYDLYKEPYIFTANREIMSEFIPTKKLIAELF